MYKEFEYLDRIFPNLPYILFLVQKVMNPTCQNLAEEAVDNFVVYPERDVIILPYFVSIGQISAVH